MNSDLPSFTIVMPTYQRRDTVADAVRALDGIAYAGDFDVVVVVDGSTDGTADALHRLSCRMPLEIIEQKNAGAAHARNSGAQAARGDVILFLDDDMMVDPEILSHHAESYAAGSDAVLGSVRIDPRSPKGFLTDGVESWIETSQGAYISAHEVFTGQLSVRRNVFEAVGGFDTRLTQGDLFGSEDTEFGQRLLAGHRLVRNSRAISYQRYVVSPRQNMARAFKSGKASVAYAAMHPSGIRHILNSSDAERLHTQLLYRPLGRVWGLARVLAGSAALLAEIGVRTPLRSNRMLARYFFATRKIAYWNAVHGAGGFPELAQVLVLCYHVQKEATNDPKIGKYFVRSEDLVEQIEYLLESGHTFIDPDTFLDSIENNTAVPPKSVLLTFDDCYPELLQIARNVLKPRKIPAICFAVTRASSNTWDRSEGSCELPLMTREQMQELSKLGCEIGSHTRTHPWLGSIDDDQVLREIAGSRDDLAAIGLTPRFLAYPFGVFDKRSIAAAQEAGYAVAFTTNCKRVTGASGAFALPRVLVRGTDSLRRFKTIVAAPSLARLMGRK